MNDPSQSGPDPRAPEAQPRSSGAQPRSSGTEPRAAQDERRSRPGAQPRSSEEELRSAKAALRKRLIAARVARPEHQRAEAGRLLRDAVLSLPEAQMAGTVAAYVSVGSEPPTRSLIYALWKRGAYVILPQLRPDDDLDWASYEGPDSLAAGPRGLLEPTEPPRGAGAIASADLVIVPALAADRLGNRLGRGGGSYDRALARVGGRIPTIALLYDDELLDEVPAGQHDQQIRLIARPAEGITRLP
jgi:5-formyltetrahydrofolate cyclo-ligase